MKCVICKNGETEAGTVTLVFEVGPATCVFQKVPARVCSNCGEAYLDEATTRRVYEMARQTAGTGLRLSVQEFNAATA